MLSSLVIWETSNRHPIFHPAACLSACLAQITTVSCTLWFSYPGPNSTQLSPVEWSCSKVYSETVNSDFISLPSGLLSFPQILSSPLSFSQTAMKSAALIWIKESSVCWYQAWGIPLPWTSIWTRVLSIGRMWWRTRSIVGSCLRMEVCIFFNTTSMLICNANGAQSFFLVCVM